MSAYRNVTFDEIEVGAAASARRVLTQTEIEALVLVSGDIEPFHMEDFGKTATGLLSVDAVGISAVISGLLERKLPGPGTRIVSLQLEYAGQVSVGDELAASVTVREKHPDTGYGDRLRRPALNKRLPDTWLLDKNYWKRAVTVFAYYTVISLAIAIPIYCVVIAVSLLIAGGQF